MTAERFAQEFRRDRLRLLHKVWRKLVLQSDENRETSDQNLSAMAREFGVSGDSVPRWAAQRNVSCLRVTRFDTPSALAFLQSVRPSYAVFTGGGLIAPETIAACGDGIINCHMGVLPQYKGMDVVEWPLLEGIFEQVGATTHVMARGVDTGPLLKGFTVDPRNYRSLGSLRNAIMGRMPFLMRDTVVALRDGAIMPQPQGPGGRQYFMLHPKIQATLPLIFREFASHQRASAATAQSG
jgi:methionyl-tRNA formyltransferase